MTGQGIEVLVQGAQYRAYCNRCGWHGRKLGTIGQAKTACAIHRREKGCAS